MSLCPGRVNETRKSQVVGTKRERGIWWMNNWVRSVTSEQYRKGTCFRNNKERVRFWEHKMRKNVSQWTKESGPCCVNNSERTLDCGNKKREYHVVWTKEWWPGLWEQNNKGQEWNSKERVVVLTKKSEIAPYFCRNCYFLKRNCCFGEIEIFGFRDFRVSENLREGHCSELGFRKNLKFRFRSKQPCKPHKKL